MHPPRGIWRLWVASAMFVGLVMGESLAQTKSEFLHELGEQGSETAYSEGLNALNRGLSKFEVGDYNAAVDALSTNAIEHVSSRDLATYFLAESYFHSARFHDALQLLAFPRLSLLLK